ncbi:hypothetical protein L9F63_014821, partial [Diploptera punctata]
TTNCGPLMSQNVSRIKLNPFSNQNTCMSHGFTKTAIIVSKEKICSEEAPNGIQPYLHSNSTPIVTIDLMGYACAPYLQRGGVERQARKLVL